MTERRWLHELIAAGDPVSVDVVDGRTILCDATTGLPLRRYESRGEQGWDGERGVSAALTDADEAEGLADQAADHRYGDEPTLIDQARTLYLGNGPVGD
jgi:hypothetical protein